MDSMNGKKCLICGAYLVWQGDNERFLTEEPKVYIGARTEVLNAPA